MTSRRGPKPTAMAAAWLSYDGAGFHGYQAQHGKRTVQGEVLRAFEALGLPRNPVVAGRTDKGVSARMQVLSFRVEPDRDVTQLASGLNQHLPADVRVEQVQRARDGFHAAWSATGREYRYQLPSELSAAQLEVLQASCTLFEGTHDFRVFHFKTSEFRQRTIEKIAVDGDFLHIVGSSFGRHMVRMMVGALLSVANGTSTVETLRRGLHELEPFHCPIAPPEPLTLWSVRYPSEVDPFVVT